MIPTANILTQQITETTYKGRTYKINFASDIVNTHKLGLNGDDELTIVSNNRLSTFTIDDDGVVSISYNVKLSGHELSQEGGLLGLTMTTELQGKDRLLGYIDGLDAVIQAIYLILSTERYQHIIYSWDYGVELLDLYGKPIGYVVAELPRRITEALTQDDRIESVDDFEFEKNGKKLSTKFTVKTNVGNISTVLEVGV